VRRQGGGKSGTDVSEAGGSNICTDRSIEQMILEMVHDRKATDVIRLLGKAAVQRCGK
jgi:hypothetical protein